MFTLYEDARSGNCYKVRLVAALCGVDLTLKHIDLLKGEQKSSDFLMINPLGKVPVLQLGQSINDCLLESNAISYFLAQSSDLVPTDAMTHARLLQWMCYEQSSFREPIGAIRFIKKYQNFPKERQAEYEMKVVLSQKALEYVDGVLVKQPYILGAALSLADLIIYAYAHVAHEGGIDMNGFAGLNQWFSRIENQPNYISMNVC